MVDGPTTPPALGTGNRLQQEIGSVSFLAATLLCGPVQGILDVSIQWPLEQQIEVFDFTAAAGTNLVTLAAPDAKHHMLVTYAFATLTNPGGGAGKFSTLFIQNGVNALGSQAITIQNMELTNLDQLPLINAFHHRVSAQPADFNVWGLPAVYVRNPFALVWAVGGMAGAEGVFCRTMTIELPRTQPLSSLINL